MNPTPRQSNARSAFTLIEVLIAAMAFAIVLAAINGVFYGALRLRNTTTRSFEESLPVQQTVDFIKRDLANIVIPGGTLGGALQTTPNLGLNGSAGPSTSSRSSLATAFGSASGSTATLQSQVQPGQSSPDFYTTTGIIDESTPFPQLQKVSYVLMQSTNGSEGRDLYRYVTRNLLSSGTQEERVMLPLLPGVESILFTFYDGNQWRTDWDTTVADLKTGLTNMLPQAIKVEIAMVSERSGRSAPSPIQIVVPISVQTSTNQVSQSSESGQNGGGQP